MNEKYAPLHGPYVAEFCGFGVPNLVDHSQNSVSSWKIMAAGQPSGNKTSITDDATFEEKTKAELLESMSKAGLPYPKTVYPSPSRQEFDENPKFWLEKITSPLISARFSDSQRRIVRKVIIGNQQEVLERLPEVDERYDTILLRDNYESLMSGTVVIDGQEVYMEAALGYLGRVIHDGDVEFRMMTNLFTQESVCEVKDPVVDLDGNFYQTGDQPPEAICQQLADVLLYIPHRRGGRDGYYEFGLVDKNGQGRIEPVFWDYNKNRNFRDVF
jgi:hypothetical protein